ncbi:MSHA biogenesis protein MshI [Shewanella salipaludis]|uniref:MSHA biogenesis protein MshI n=1 Tax=Shewanella salipaludis TaxID=2723052 RepID=A0A972FYX1_9GAMM|nr:MSHA biogenesis protein MshI [Shewanella salipaludis]NMH65207.1 MSHA biogenesis protein MshI [Shewanella salipaludis]
MGNSLLGKFAFWQKPQSVTDLGIYVGADTLWVYRAPTQEGPATVSEIGLQAEDWLQTFAGVVKQFGQARVSVLLAASRYQLLLADKPQVEAQEMQQALLWSIKDMVSIPVSQIHLDYFDYPLPGITKVNVVVTDSSSLSPMVRAMIDSGLEITSIGIEELAMTNLFVDDPQARLVLSHQPGQELLLTVVKQGQLLMQRRVRGFSRIDKMSAEDLSLGMADNLSLEIQRSMDYFESQLRQAPVASIEVLMEGPSRELTQLLGGQFNQQVNLLEQDTVAAHMAALALAELSREDA